MDAKQLTGVLRIAADVSKKTKATGAAAQAITDTVLLEQSSGGTRIKATNLDTYIDIFVPGDIKGTCVIRSSRLLDVIKRKRGDVSIEAKKFDDWSDLGLEIGTDGYVTRLYPALTPSDFPGHDVPRKKIIEIENANLFLHTLAFALTVAATEPTRYALNTICLEFSDKSKTLQIVSTDGKRLFLSSPICDYHGKLQNFLIPVPSAKIVVKALKSQEGPVTLYGNSKVISFNRGDATVVTKLCDDQFPSHKDVIPSKQPNAVTVNTARMIAALNQVDPLTTPENQAMNLSFSDNTMRFTKTTKDVGEMEATIEAETVGKGEIRLNPRFIANATKAANGTMELSMTDGERPLRIDTEKGTHVIMPVSMK